MARLAGLSFLIFLGAAAGCGEFTDAATRIAYDIEAGADRLGKQEGARTSIVHHEPSKRGECEGPYKVQLDKVGALIVWCYDASGRTVSSHSTTYHARFVDTQQTWLLDKPAGSDLVIEVERRGGRAVMVEAR
jgi:hypothetical protein